jgi:hypothetical protein
VEDSRGIPAGDITPAVTITTPGGKTQPVTLEKDKPATRFRAILAPPSEAGIYTLNAKAVIGGREITAKQVFQLTTRDLESRDVLADFKALQSIARAGKGRFVPLREIGSLMKRLKGSTRPRIKETFMTEDLLAPWIWPLIILLIVMFCAEWVLRKKYGLV